MDERPRYQAVFTDGSYHPTTEHAGAAFVYTHRPAQVDMCHFLPLGTAPDPEHGSQYAEKHAIIAALEFALENWTRQIKALKLFCDSTFVIGDIQCQWKDSTSRYHGWQENLRICDLIEDLQQDHDIRVVIQHTWRNVEQRNQRADHFANQARRDSENGAPSGRQELEVI